MIWIVGILHVIGYLMNPGNLPVWFNRILECFTITCLATFTFLSGHFLCKKVMYTKKDIVNFFKRRFKRFFVLYLIACLSLYLAGILMNNDTLWFRSFQQLVTVLFGLSGLIPGYQPATFWYFSMIILFYIITPLIALQKTYENKITTILIIGIFLIFETLLFKADIRLPFYYIFYCLGGLWNEKSTLRLNICFQIILLLCLSQVLNLDFYLSIQNFIVGLLGVNLLLSVGKTIKRPILVSFFSFVAYASMCAYLYHRHIYSAVKLLCNKDYWPVMLWPFVVISTFIIGYFIQLIYDKILLKISVNKMDNNE